MNERDDSFVFYATFLDTMDSLYQDNPDLANRYLRCVCEYGVYGDYENDDPVIDALMISVKFGINNSKKKRTKDIRNGARGGAPSKYDKDEILDYIEEGHTQAEASKKFGVSVRTIGRYMSEIRSADAELEDRLDEDGNFVF